MLCYERHDIIEIGQSRLGENSLHLGRYFEEDHLDSILENKSTLISTTKPSCNAIKLVARGNVGVRLELCLYCPREFRLRGLRPVLGTPNDLGQYLS